jgi:hypothetical protein
MTTGPQGQRMTVEQRLTEIGYRYGPDHLVSRALARSAPELIAAVVRVTRKLATCSPIAATHAGGRVPGDGGRALAEVGVFAVLCVVLDA